MRRLWILLALCLALALPVRALDASDPSETATAPTETTVASTETTPPTEPPRVLNNTLDMTAQVRADGSCRIDMTLKLLLPQPVSQLVIPLGKGAEDVTLGGMEAKTEKVDSMPCLVLQNSASFSGNQNLSISYSLANCVQTVKPWTMTVPILPQGLAYAMDQVTFRITLPTPPQLSPVFTSGYLGEDVDNYMHISVAESVISGTVNVGLRDRDSLTMTLETNDGAFHREAEAGSMYATARMAGLAFAALAALYWLLRLRWRPFLAAEVTRTPLGFGAGEVGCRMLAQSPDLALTVLSWAQMGYVGMRENSDGSVILYRRMEMGNERSGYENQLFHRLFRGHESIHCRSRHYRILCAEVAASPPRTAGMFQGRGRPGIARLLGALSALFTGVAMADRIAGTGWIRIPVLILLGLAAAICAWLLQDGLKSFFGQGKKPGLLALAGGAGILTLGLLSHCVALALLCCAMQLLLGLAVLFGGRRSEAGRATLQQLLGLRQYLKRINSKQIHLALQNNPRYYFDMAPYAASLGVDRRFAGRFAQIPVTECPWLVTERIPPRTAGGWCELLRQVLLELRPAPPSQPAPDRRSPPPRTGARRPVRP